MKKFLKLIFLLFSIQFLFSQEITIPQAINLIGKESMLTQRMGKDKIYHSHSTQESTHIKKELFTSIIQFEKNIELLKSVNLTSEIQEDLTHLELLWIGYKKSVDTDDKTNNGKVIIYNNVILEVCNNINDKLLTTAKNNKLYPYNNSNEVFAQATMSSNKLKQLSQRLSLFYFAYFFNEIKYDGEVFNKIISDIETNITAIKKAENIGLEIKQSTEDVIFQWKNLKAILNNVIKTDFISSHSSPETSIIFEQCNKFLYYSDLLTRTYKSSNDLNKI